MANQYLDKNGLLYLWQKITGKFVAKETGKGLSSNDYTTTEKDKLSALPGIKQIGTGLELTEAGTLNASGGGTADAVAWENVTDKPSTLAGYGITDAASKTHNHDSTYLKLSGGKMTGPIEFSPDQGQIKAATDTAEAKIELDTQAVEIIFTDKDSGKTNRMTVSDSGAVIAVGESTPGDGTGVQVTVDTTNGVKIPMVATPVNDRDAANKKYVDDGLAQKAATNHNHDSSYYKKSETYSKTEIDEKGFLTEHQDISGKADKATTLAGYGISDAYTKDEVNSKLSAVYKPGGSVLFSELPEPSAENVGFVYNLKEAFVTDDRFLASTPVPYPIGTDVAVVAVPGDPVTYMFDVLAGFVDLSGYWKKSDLVAITNGEIDEIVGVA